MVKFKYVLWVAALVSVLMINGVAQASNIPSQSSVATQVELDATFNWPEAGLSFDYPSNWQPVNDQNADFLLAAPVTDNQIVYLALQSGLYDAANESVEEIMVSFVDSPEDLSEILIGEVVAYEFRESSNGLSSIFIGFTSDEVNVHLLNLTVSDVVADEWMPVLEDIVASLTIELLSLDAETLNAQLQANYEATGRLIVGELDAAVQIYEFLDFACPHCVDYHDDLNRLVQDQVQTGNANLQFGIMTFVAAELSENAAAAQVCAAKLGIGWDMHNLLFKSYRFDGRVAYELDAIVENVTSAELDVDMDEFVTCLNDEDTLSDYLAIAQADAAEYSVNSTPTLLFAGTESDFALLTLPNGQSVSRTNLNLIYAYISSLAE